VYSEQEYDAAADMMDDPADGPDTPSGPGPYPGAAAFGSDPQVMSLASPATSTPSGNQSLQGQPGLDAVAQAQQSGFPTMTQLLDPALDWDPFGLSASMAFPTQFTFDTSNLR
jgi:hypothetical protein